MRAFLKDLGAEFRSPAPWISWVAVSAVVSIAGPFGTYGALTTPDRALFWTPVIALSVFLSSVVRALVKSLWNLQSTMQGSVLIAGLNSWILAPILYLVILYVLPDPLHDIVSPGEIVLLIASVSMGICALRGSVSPSLEEAQPAGVKMPRLLRRIDPDLHGDIWAITVRDHYVDVQTSHGKASLLMRFSDAMDEVDCQEGAQVHRSHWVAWAGVGRVIREGGKLVLHLKNGHQIPVSRNHRAKVDAQFPPPAPAFKDDSQQGAA